jgi:hypothetical protein
MSVKRYIICSVAALALVGCSVDYSNIEDPVIPEPGEGETEMPQRPTVPLKKRPIVPTSKLPRPRFAEVLQSDEGRFVVMLQPEAGVATVTITECDGRVTTYIIDNEVLELSDVSEHAFDIAVEVDGVVEVYTIME